MQIIKYRQPLYHKGEFNMWHYWGLLPTLDIPEECRYFVSPQNHYTDSFQLIPNLDARNSKELYDGDVVDLYDWGMKSSDDKIGKAVIEWDDQFKQWDYRMIEGGMIDDRYDIWRAGRVLITNIIESPEFKGD